MLHDLVAVLDVPSPKPRVLHASEASTYTGKRIQLTHTPLTRSLPRLTVLVGVSSADGGRSASSGIGHGEGVGEALRGRGHVDAGAQQVHLAVDGLADDHGGGRRVRDHEGRKVQAELRTILIT